MEVAVCDRHHQEISDGAPWAVQDDLDTNHDAVLIGKDLAVAGLLPLTKFTGTNEEIGFPDGTVQLEFEAVDGTPVKFLLTHDAARSMAAALPWFVDDDDAAEDPHDGGLDS